MDLDRPRPNRDQLSSMTALVLITLSLVRLVVLPEFSFSFSTMGLLIEFKLNTRLIFLFLAAALTTAGTDWLVRSHPGFQSGSQSFQHWIIPMLTAYAGGALVTQLPAGSAMWIGLGLIVILLISVLITEFIVVSPQDERYTSATVSIFALAFLLLTGGYFVLRSAGIRILFSFPIILIMTTAVAWRLLLLRSPEPSILPHAVSIGLILAEIHAGLHYFPVPPLQESLLLFILSYAGIGLMSLHLEDRISRRSLTEYGLISLVALLMVILFL
jgi:hypothetical protein